MLLLDCCYGGAFAKGIQVKADASVHTADHVDARGRARALTPLGGRGYPRPVGNRKEVGPVITVSSAPFFGVA